MELAVLVQPTRDRVVSVRRIMFDEPGRGALVVFIPSEFIEAESPVWG